MGFPLIRFRFSPYYYANAKARYLFLWNIDWGAAHRPTLETLAVKSAM